MFLDFLLPKRPSVKRHLLKTISWRIIGTIDTIIISWVVTGEFHTGLKVGGVEVITKMVLYFIHERIWFKLDVGLPHRDKAKSTEEKNNE